MINITDKQHCCGCAACVQVCPKQCIAFHEDKEGFAYPEVDTTTCINCGLCEKVCPELHPIEPRNPLSVYAAINTDTATRLQSSSGGIFTALAETIIRQGGVVFGTRFDESWKAVMDHTETLEGLKAFRGSKYLQASVGTAFADAEKFLKAGRKVMFTGTPCQIAGLLHYLRKPYDGLLTVDFACHGVPSPKVWRMYLDEVTGNAWRAIRNIQFRNKANGWRRFNFVLDYDCEQEHIVLSSYHRENHYMRAFLRNMILRPSCHQCPAKGGRSQSDITIADFWGIQHVNPQMDDDKGTGLVLVNTERGAQVFSHTNVKSHQESYEDAVQHNSAIERSVAPHPKRADFFKRLDKSESVIALIEKELRPSLKQRMKKYLKHMLANTSGGGKFEEQVENIIIPLAHDAIEICDVNFRNKTNGWKRYEMTIICK